VRLTGEMLLRFFLVSSQNLHFYKYSIKCILKESGHESFDWINVVQDTARGRLVWTWYRTFRFRKMQ